MGASIPSLFQPDSPALLRVATQDTVTGEEIDPRLCRETLSSHSDGARSSPFTDNPSGGKLRVSSEVEVSMCFWAYLRVVRCLRDWRLYTKAQHVYSRRFKH